MSFQIPLFLYVVLMSSLALMVRWESVRRRKGPSSEIPESAIQHRQIARSAHLIRYVDRLDVGLVAYQRSPV